MADKPVIFISYSHRDRAWLDYVRSFFAPLAEHLSLLIWDDEKLCIGDDWRGDIYSALDACRVFILLASRYSLASKFILNDEVGRILKRPKGEVQLCPIVLTPYFVKGLAWLDQPNRRPKDGKALSELPDPERDREMAVIAGQIDEILSRTTAPTVVTTTPRPISPATTAISYPSIVDYGRLPETPYKKLVGREAELKRLDEAWADTETRVISLVAWGGAGKTSLVIEWLMRVRNDGYRNASAVLCWSFYSQGTKERSASGEGFVDWALGKLKVKIDTTSATAKGERLAEEMSRRRVLLVLDGLEPLQYGPEGQQGALKDQGLRAFLRGLAVKQPAAGHSLVVVTSRLAVNDLQKWQETTAPVIDLGRLSDEAGAALLTDNGVKGNREALRETAHDFDGHALALSLLASFLRLLHGAKVEARHRIRPAIDDPSGPGHDQARRVIEAFDQEWLAGEPRLLAIMQIVGLFDRPVSKEWIAALRGQPVIDGVTNAIADIDEKTWRAAVSRLREVRLLDPEDSHSPDALDAHPLVREWFGERLRQTNQAAWKAAHGRIYEYLRDMTKEGETPTLDDLAPLFQAIAHGCCAGRHQEALDDIYLHRICRQLLNGDTEFYANKKLGAIGSDLAAISWFFDKPYETPLATLTEPAQSWVLSIAAFNLRAQGRFADALVAQRAGSQREEAAESWRNAAISASNISQVELLAGAVTAAVASAAKSVEHAHRSGDALQVISKLGTHAAALHVAGRHAEAEALFAEAERMHRDLHPKDPELNAMFVYLYCDLLLAKGKWAAACDQVTKAIDQSKARENLLDFALDTLTLGRSHHGLALGSDLASALSANAPVAHARLDEAVDGLRGAGTTHYLPRGLLARASFRGSIGDWDSAARDLDEVEEIAESGPMKLWLCDMAIERARLALAKIEAFAPLHGMIDGGPPKPEPPGEMDRRSLHDEAGKQLAIAAEYVETCGYHKHDQELAELQAVLRSEKKFSGLPPRV